MVQHPSPLAPLLFPIPNLLATAKLPPSPSKPAPQPILPTLCVADYVALVATSVRASALAYMVVFLVSPSGFLVNKICIVSMIKHLTLLSLILFSL